MHVVVATAGFPLTKGGNKSVTTLCVLLLSPLLVTPDVPRTGHRKRPASPTVPPPPDRKSKHPHVDKKRLGLCLDVTQPLLVPTLKWNPIPTTTAPRATMVMLVPALARNVWVCLIWIQADVSHCSMPPSPRSIEDNPWHAFKRPRQAKAHNTPFKSHPKPGLE